MDYKSSGVDVKAGEAAVKAIKNVVKQTYNQNVLSELGSFGGLYKLDQNQWKQPILVASTDGVGTKIKVAIMAGIYDTIGQDLLNHCVNDILVQGAHPQFFLDYIGLSGMDTAKVETIIGGLVKACSENSCALIGGEMAEMPGIYHADDFDLVGTIIGFVEKDRLIPREIAPGAVLLGFPSTGLHTNGYSLARKIVFEHLGLKVDSYVQELGMTVAETLLSIHKSYYQVLLPYLANQALLGLAHITGGGIEGNLKRIIPANCTAEIDLKYPVPPLFTWLKDAGKLADDVAYQAFNMGVGMIAVVRPELVDAMINETDAFALGRIVPRRDDAAVILQR
ncbi:MAG: phosphoribosylformylglycinamidine cyclo-ligase [Candidatus Cloacimonetes bacterium HGW-Cloacimonetes-2]|jgi:phosphoribosylformylglycinamidine cyclo-ligase|nr:MAG: phosphoribosylformylglycinamidine cyclo-ligase [Candidatus Cloacimonetes bacterium HGW-Cloacimonetes-2]